VAEETVDMLNDKVKALEKDQADLRHINKEHALSFDKSSNNSAMLADKLQVTEIRLSTQDSELKIVAEQLASLNSEYNAIKFDVENKRKEIAKLNSENRRDKDSYTGEINALKERLEKEAKGRSDDITDQLQAQHELKIEIQKQNNSIYNADLHCNKLAEDLVIRNKELVRKDDDIAYVKNENAKINAELDEINKEKQALQNIKYQ